MAASSSQSNDAVLQQMLSSSEMTAIDASFQKLNLFDSEEEHNGGTLKTDRPTSMENIEDKMRENTISAKTEENEVTPSPSSVNKEDEQMVFENIVLHVCHYNCRTLNEKLIEMDNALKEIECDVIGLAETKRSTSGRVTMESGRTLFNSASDAGHHGVGFIVTSPELAATAVFEPISPRLATLQLPEHGLHLVEAYAPTLPQSDNIYNKFMYQVSEACRRRLPGYRLILLGDFNARVEQNDTNMDIVGEFTYGDRNKRGVVVVEICRELKIRLLNTFEELPEPWRWTHKRARGGCKAQIDYIAANMSDQVWSLSILSMDEFNYVSDHRLLSLQFRTRPMKKINGKKKAYRPLKPPRHISCNPLALAFCKMANSILSSEQVTEVVTAHSSTGKKTDSHIYPSAISLIQGKDIFEECEGEANIENLHILKMIIEKSVEYQTGLYLAFLDIRTAFSAADWYVVKKNLQQQELLDETETEACQGDFFTAGLAAAVRELLKAAVNDEDICGVVLTYKGLEKSFKLLTSGHNCIFFAPSTDQMTIMLENTIKCLSRVGMDLNVENIDFMTESKKKNETKPRKNIHFGDKTLKFVDSIIYLGCRISIPFKHDKEVERRISLGHVAFNRLRPFLCSSHLPMKQKRELFEVYVSSVTLYGSETWVLKADAKKMLQACQRRLESKMLGITELDKWPEEKMRQITGIKNWLRSAEWKKEEWAKKITSESSLYPCTSTKWTPQNGKRKPGNPLRWSTPRKLKHGLQSEPSYIYLPAEAVFTAECDSQLRIYNKNGTDCFLIAITYTLAACRRFFEDICRMNLENEGQAHAHNGQNPRNFLVNLALVFSTSPLAPGDGVGRIAKVDLLRRCLPDPFWTDIHRQQDAAETLHNILTGPPDLLNEHLRNSYFGFSTFVRQYCSTCEFQSDSIRHEQINVLSISVYDNGTMESFFLEQGKVRQELYDQQNAAQRCICGEAAKSILEDQMETARHIFVSVGMDINKEFRISDLEPYRQLQIANRRFIPIAFVEFRGITNRDLYSESGHYVTYLLDNKARQCLELDNETPRVLPTLPAQVLGRLKVVLLELCD